MKKRIRGYRKGSVVKIMGRDFEVSYEDGYDGSTMYLTGKDLIIRVDCGTQNLYQQGMGPMGSGGYQEDFYTVHYSVKGEDFQEWGQVTYLPRTFDRIVS